MYFTLWCILEINIEGCHRGHLGSRFAPQMAKMGRFWASTQVPSHAQWLGQKLKLWATQWACQSGWLVHIARGRALLSPLPCGFSKNPPWAIPPMHHLWGAQCTPGVEEWAVFDAKIKRKPGGFTPMGKVWTLPHPMAICGPHGAMLALRQHQGNNG